MTPDIIIGLAAGLISALLVGSAQGMTSLSIILALIAPLPCFLAGFGWGLRACAIAGLTGAFALALASNPSVAIDYAAKIGVPCAFLVYLTTLCRVVANQNDGADNSEKPNIEWYPVGHIVLWTAIMAGIISTLTFWQTWGSVEVFQAEVDKLIKEHMVPNLTKWAGKAPDPKLIATYKDAALATFPSSLAISWMASTLLNMWLAMNIAHISERLSRPKPDVPQMALPMASALILVPATLFALSFDMVGLTARAFLGALLFAYFLMGLAIVHAIIPQSPSRSDILVAIYIPLIISLVILTWPALILILLGLSDPVMKWRERKPAGPLPPGST